MRRIGLLFGLRLLPWMRSCHEGQDFEDFPVFPLLNRETTAETSSTWALPTAI